MSPRFHLIFLLFILLQFGGFFSISTLETYKINLDLPPEERWKEVILAKKQYIQNYTQLVLQKMVLPRFSLFLSDLYGNTFFKGSDFAREIEGVAYYSNQSFAEVFLMNYMYETFAFCTSIVFENDSGDVVLGHNLDYYFGEPMARSIVLLEFLRNGKLLYKAHAIAGQIGVFTGLKSNKFAMTFNQRETNDVVIHWKQLFINRVFPVLYNIRLGLEHISEYTEMLRYLSEISLGSPCYFILCGNGHNEGAVITRNPTNVSAIVSLNDTNNDGWFLVQTNSDRNGKYVDYRRAVGENRTRSIGRYNITARRMMEDVLYLYPNKNEITMLSSYVRPQTGEFETTLWQ